jgi:hypothetical protein
VPEAFVNQSPGDSDITKNVRYSLFFGSLVPAYTVRDVSTEDPVCDQTLRLILLETRLDYPISLNLAGQLIFEMPRI